MSRAICFKTCVRVIDDRTAVAISQSNNNRNVPIFFPDLSVSNGREFSWSTLHYELLFSGKSRWCQFTRSSRHNSRDL